tara:strand:- start:4243 stop:4503 length:261 start_codon:yes stop_codon:yes gene_type:complete
MRADEIADWCGFDDEWDMLTDNLDDDELMDLLRVFVYSDKEGLIQEMIEDWAKYQYDWVDHEKIKADYEDMKYQEWKDSRGERDER